MTNDLFRSVDMSYIQVLVPATVAEEFVDRVGQEGCIQFTDLNEDLQPFQRQYTADIIRIQEIERQIKSIEEVLNEYNIAYDSSVAPEDLVNNRRPPNASQVIDKISKEINDHYKELKEQATAEKQLFQELTSQEAIIGVLSQLEKFLSNSRQLVEERLGGAESGDVPPDDSVPLRMGDQPRGGVGFKYFAGVVSIGQRVAFERQIFLTSRGNSFIQFDESNEENSDKIPFVVFFIGDQLKRQLKRLCQFMNIPICYESDSDRSRDDLLAEAQNKNNDFNRIHNATKKQLNAHMKDVANRLKLWKVSLLQEKSIRITLNKYRLHQGNVLRAEGWIPVNKIQNVNNILDDVVRNKGVGRAVLTQQQTKNIHPTYFETNDFTAPFQAIVDTYGVPRYKEFNPAVPTIVTFPFLFGVMYGDIFHGSCLFLFASCLIIFSRQLEHNKSLASIYSARYTLFLMGFFAIYCGLIYNDVMSIMINGFNGTQWSYYETTTIGGGGYYGKVPVQNNVYGFGIDPAWHGVDNQLSFENGLKMKLSVIIGVIQMTFGLFLKLFNHIYENDYISLFCEFIPQLIFMLSFFGYMIFLIIFKWCISWGQSDLYNTPSLITVLIKMVLSPSSEVDKDLALYDAGTQGKIQMAFVLLMLFSIPWMLIPKPFLLKKKHEEELLHARIQHNGGGDHDVELPQSSGISSNLDDKKTQEGDDIHDIKPKSGHGGGHGHGEEFEFSEVMIHQLIHTIEYVLGTVSNTASYLRLWALSLAHAELSTVFYEKTVQGTIGTSPVSFSSVLMTVVAVFMFFMFTFGVLLVMDVLECFLHALRLHWVEFQSKFFYADGIKFEPFSYKSMAEKENE